MTFVNANIMGQSTFLLRLTWKENNGEISLFDYGNCKTWKGQVYACILCWVYGSMCNVKRQFHRFGNFFLDWF